ncbi:MAG: hypoxanthine phosphoribosyltransferase [Victivallaceae bacterium]
MPRQIISSEQICGKVGELGRQIADFYRGQPLMVIAVCNGALLFAADLVREIKIPLQLDVIAASSYSGSASSGEIKFRSLPKLPVAGKNVLIVDDILDSGLTLGKIVELMRSQNCLSVKTCVLLKKQTVGGPALEADWHGFEIPDVYVFGYGLDRDEYDRNLAYIATESNNFK